MSISLPGGFKAYKLRHLRLDLAAGLTVAIVALPQSMAYALIAGVDPVYGLYASVVAAIVGALFGSSNHLITGPTNAIALMVASAMKDFAGGEDFLTRLFLLTFLVGLFQLILGLLRVGKVINFVSHSVIVGFTAGAGIIIALGQVNQFFGISIAKGYHPLYERVYLTLTGLERTNLYALGLACLTVAIVIIGKKIGRNIPGSLLGIVISSVLAAVFDLADKGVGLVGEMPNNLPLFRMPGFGWDLLGGLTGGAVAIALVGLVEAISIAKSISLTSGQAIDPNREFVGQGLANMTAAFFQCIPSSGSFTRSAINLDAKAQTRLAAVFSGVLAAVGLVALAPYAGYIPHASLAGVIVVVAYNMVNKHAMAKIAKASRFDAAVMSITILATIIMPDLEKAILAGIAVSVIVHLWQTGEVKVRILMQDGKGGFKEAKPAPHVVEANPSGILVVHVEGDLYFGSAADLEEKMRPIVQEPNAQVCIIRLKRINVVDISAFEALEGVIRRLLASGKTVLLCGVSDSLKRFIDAVGLTALVGEDHIFLAEDRIYASANKAYQKAREVMRAG